MQLGLSTTSASLSVELPPLLVKKDFLQRRSNFRATSEQLRILSAPEPHIYTPCLWSRGTKPWEGHLTQKSQIPPQVIRRAGGSHSRKSGSCRSQVKGAEAAPRPRCQAENLGEHTAPTHLCYTSTRFVCKHVPAQTAHTHQPSNVCFHSSLQRGSLHLILRWLRRGGTEGSRRKRRRGRGMRREREKG